MVQMQWQLIPETTMHAFDINALLTIIAINKLTDRTGADPKKFRKWPEADTIFFSQWKNDQCGSKNTHAAVPEKLTINFVWPWESYKFSLIYSFRASEFTPGFWWGLHCSFFSFLCNVWKIFVCPFSFGHCIVCPSIYHFAIFKLFFNNSFD